MAIKTGKKIAVADISRRRGRLMSRLMLQESTHESTSVATDQKIWFLDFSAQISRGRLMSRLMPCGSTHESTHRSCQARKLACQGEFLRANQLTVPWVDSWVDSCTSNLHNFKNISPNTMKFSPIDFKSFVLPNGTIKSGF